LCDGKNTTRKKEPLGKARQEKNAEEVFRKIVRGKGRELAASRAGKRSTRGGDAQGGTSGGDLLTNLGEEAREIVPYAGSEFKIKRMTFG